MGLREGLFSRGLPQLRSAVNGRSPRRPRTPKERQRREEDVLREEHARREALTTDTLLRKIEPLF